jgi:hypothetical protein
MMKAILALCASGIALGTVSAVYAQTSSASPSGNVVPVTSDNFIRAESDRYFAINVTQSGGELDTFHHDRDIASVNNQPVVRYNRDVLLRGMSRKILPRLHAGRTPV